MWSEITNMIRKSDRCREKRLLSDSDSCPKPNSAVGQMSPNHFGKRGLSISTRNLEISSKIFFPFALREAIKLAWGGLFSIDTGRMFCDHWFCLYWVEELCNCLQTSRILLFFVEHDAAGYMHAHCTWCINKVMHIARVTWCPNKVMHITLDAQIR